MGAKTWCIAEEEHVVDCGWRVDVFGDEAEQIGKGPRWP